MRLSGYIRKWVQNLAHSAKNHLIINDYGHADKQKVKTLGLCSICKDFIYFLLYPVNYSKLVYNGKLLLVRDAVIRMLKNHFQSFPAWGKNSLVKSEQLIFS